MPKEGTTELKSEPIDNVLLNPMDYDVGFWAIRDLLARLEQDEKELQDQIDRIDAIARKSSGFALSSEALIDS